MPDSPPRTVEEFDTRYAPEGRLRSYARGRVQNFWPRQALTLTGSIFLIFLVSVPVGMMACTIALLGEAVDCLTLRRVGRMLDRGVPLRRVYLLTTLTGAFQSATIAGAVTLSWLTTPHVGGTFFTLAYLTGAVINAGIVLPFHPAVTKARLAVFIVCLVGLLVQRALYDPPEPASLLIFDLLGVLMMGYMAYLFIAYMVEGFHRQRQSRRETLLRSEALSIANAELRDRQRELRRLSLVARHARDSVIMSDAAGRILWVNATFEKVTGYSCDDARGLTPADLLNGPGTDLSVSDGIAAAIRAGQPHRAEILNYTKDGRQIWVETNIVPVLDEHDQVEMVIAIERDVTQAREHAQELARAKVAAEDGARAKSQFLATMSHEIRTPMNGVIGMADLLCEVDLPADYRGYALTIRNSAEALLTILNDILDLSKLEAGKIDLSPVDFSPSECLSGVVGLLQAQALGKGLALNLCATDLPPMLRADDTRLRQVLLNIIGNAVKFTATGHVCIRARVSRINGAQLLHIRVCDTGIGIPRDRLDHIFDPFSQAEADTTRRFGGTGLGLSISRKLIEAMGGVIRVRSVVGQGSCFTVHHPVLPPKGDRPRPATAAVAPVQALTVLVAEDNRTNRLIIEKYLSKTPIRLHFAHDGQQAVTMTREHRPDVIFMDMAMPLMDGLAATRKIRADGGVQPRIVALTANGFASDRDACLAAGMDGFLTKPVRKADLLHCLAKAQRLAPEKGLDGSRP